MGFEEFGLTIESIVLALTIMVVPGVLGAIFYEKILPDYIEHSRSNGSELLTLISVPLGMFYLLGHMNFSSVPGVKTFIAVVFLGISAFFWAIGSLSLFRGSLRKKAVALSCAVMAFSFIYVQVYEPPAETVSASKHQQNVTVTTERVTSAAPQQTAQKAQPAYQTQPATKTEQVPYQFKHTEEEAYSVVYNWFGEHPGVVESGQRLVVHRDGPIHLYAGSRGFYKYRISGLKNYEWELTILVNDENLSLWYSKHGELGAYDSLNAWYRDYAKACL